MGEVYRAKDTRLDRIVAIKVLPSHLSENPNLKQRFEQEARTISSLSHVNTPVYVVRLNRQNRMTDEKALECLGLRRQSRYRSG